MFSGTKSGSAAWRLGLERLEEPVVFDGVVDGRGGEEGVEAAAAGGGIVLGEDGLDDGLLGEGLAGLGQRFRPSGLK